jgi:uncharacterized phiE125 gp8 family phage protein
MDGLKLVVAPTVEPVTAAEAIAYCKATPDLEASLFELWIRGARQQVEEYLGRALLTQRWELTLDAFPAEPLVLPRPPLVSVVSLTTYNPSNVSAVCSSAVYQVDTSREPGRVALVSGQSWPSDLRTYSGVVWRFEAGYGSTRDTVPAPIVESVLALVAQRFSWRGDDLGGERMPAAVVERLAPYRLWAVA